MMSGLCETTPLITNLRKPCEYAPESDLVDDCIEQTVGTLQCVESIIVSPNRTLSCVRAGAGQHREPFF
jgi:hypothetical protein